MARNVEYDWHLTDWMTALSLSQADICRATGFSKAKISELVNGVSRYNRDVVNAIANAMNIRPYELLMDPAEASGIKALRQTALSIVAASNSESGEQPARISDVRKFRK